MSSIIYLNTKKSESRSDRVEGAANIGAELDYLLRKELSFEILSEDSVEAYYSAGISSSLSVYKRKRSGMGLSYLVYPEWSDEGTEHYVTNSLVLEGGSVDRMKRVIRKIRNLFEEQKGYRKTNLHVIK